MQTGDIGIVPATSRVYREPELSSRTRRLQSLASFAFFADLTEPESEQLAHASQTRVVNKGQLIYLPGDRSEHAYLLVSGRVKTSRLSDNGKELILEIVEPGSLFGEAGVVDETSRETMAEALEPSVVWAVPASRFRAVLARNPSLLAELVRIMSRRQRILEKRLLDVVHKNAPERLAQLLLELGKRYGVPDARGTLLRIKVSQTTLGNWLGVSREIVNHTFSNLKRRGVIELAAGRVIIRDADALATSAT